MNAFFDRYNLSAFERRLTVIVGMAIFLVINMMFIWPQFSEGEEIKEKTDKAHQRLRTYRAAIENGKALKTRLTELERAGSDVLPAERANQLVTIIQTTAAQTKLPAPSVVSARMALSDPSKEQFFEQIGYSVSTTTDSDPLIAFLIAIGSNDDVIRVRDLDLKPETNKRNRLQCKMTLVANYKKQPSEKTGVQGRKQ